MPNKKKIPNNERRSSKLIKPHANDFNSSFSTQQQKYQQQQQQEKPDGLDEQQIEHFHEIIAKLKLEKEAFEAQVKKVKIEITRLENRLKKQEIGHEVEKRNIKTKTKNKCVMQQNLRIEELQKNFKNEMYLILEQFNVMRGQVIKKDYLIKKLINIIVMQEQQNSQFRTELCISDHPRWQLIPSYEVITILDLAKLISMIQQKFHPSLIESHPEQNEDVLTQIYKLKTYSKQFTNPTASPLGLLLQGSESAFREKKRPTLKISQTFKKFGDDARVLRIKIERLKDKIIEYDEKLEKQNDEFLILKSLYEDHINAYQSAVCGRKALEDELRSLRNNEEGRVNEMIADYVRKEQNHSASLQKTKDDFDKFKTDTMHELKLKDVLVERQKNFIILLKKELLYAKNILKNPNLYQKAFEEMNYDKVEYYQLEKRPVSRIADKNLAQMRRTGGFSMPNSPKNYICKSAFEIPQIPIEGGKRITNRNLRKSQFALFSDSNNKNPIVISRRNREIYTSANRNNVDSTMNEDIDGFSNSKNNLTPANLNNTNISMSRQNISDLL